MGPVGAGQATKAVNQVMAAGINQAVTEALAFGQAAGLDMDRVIEVVGSGAAGNWFLSHRGQAMVDGSFRSAEQRLLHQFRDAIGIDTENYNAVYQVLMLKNDFSIF